MPFGFDPIGGSALTDAQLHAPKASTQVPVAGVVAASSLGVPTFLAHVRYDVAGVVAQVVVGAPTLSGKATMALNGVQASLAGPVLGSLSMNGSLTAFARSLAATPELGFAGVAVTALHVTLTAPSLSSSAAVGGVTVSGVSSRFYIDASGVQAFCLLGVPGLQLGAGAAPDGVAARAELGTDVIVLTSSFGVGASAAVPSQWTPVPAL